MECRGSITNRSIRDYARAQPIIKGVEFTMRLPTYAESLFGVSIVFFCCYLAAFNYELLGRDEVCAIDLLTTHAGKCLVSPRGSSNIRLIVKFGGDRDTVGIKIPVSIDLKSDSYSYSKDNITQKSASAGAVRRYYQTLNYGDYKVPNNEETVVFLRAGAGIEKLRLFRAEVVASPNNTYVYLFGGLFLLFLLLSIFFRRNTFMQKYGKPIPYVLYFFVALITLTWNI